MRKFLLSLLFGATVLTAGAKEDYVPTLWGNVIEMDSWSALSDYSKPFAVRSFKATSDIQFTQVSPTSANFFANANGIITSDGIYHFCYYGFDDYYYMNYTQLYTYNTKTWELVKRPEDVADNFRAFDLAENPLTHTVYGFFINDANQFSFGTVDYSTNSRKDIARTDTAYYALACSNEGQLYAISAGGNLWKIDASNGRPTLVGDLGLTAQGLSVSDHVQSATFDPKTDKMYWAGYFWDSKNIKYVSSLYEVDVENHTATKIGDFPETAQVVALYIPKPEAEDDAPAAATGVTATFENANLTGDIDFTAPTKTFAGDDLSTVEDLNYVVTAGTDTLAKGACAPGEQVSAPVTVAANGEYEFVVTTSNGSGRSPEAKIIKYVGYDQPSKVSNLKATLTGDSTITVSWSRPDSTVHGGYCDFSALKYQVEGQAEQTTDTSFNVTVDPSDFTAYSFSVKAINGTVESALDTTNVINLGPAKTLPYTEDFSGYDAIDQFNVLDLNGDKRYEESWGYVIANEGYWQISMNGCARYINSSNRADDWAITPRIALQAGKTYKLKFDSKRDVERYTECLGVAFGKLLDPSKYTTLIENMNPNYDEYKTDSVTFTVPEDGLYFIGFHAFSPANQSYIFLDNISVEEVTVTDGISAISSDKDGDGNAPVYNLAGQRVDRNYRGIVIIDGKKMLRK